MMRDIRSMQGMRDLLRGSLAGSLRTLPEEDRLSAALPVVCGAAMAAHCSVDRLDERRTLHLRVDSGDWLKPLLGMRDLLRCDLARVAGVALDGIELETRPERQRGSLVGSEGASSSTTGGRVLVTGASGQKLWKGRVLP